MSITSTTNRWKRTTLGDIGEYINGRGFKKEEWRKEGRPIIRIQDLTGSGSAPNYFSGHCDPKHEVNPGDLLISWAATLGAYIWRGPEAVLNQHIFKVRSNINKMFHYYLVTSILDDLRRQSHGSGMVHITKSRFESTEVSIPPEPEQEAIVEEIEKQFTRLDAAVASLRRIQTNLKRFNGAAVRSLMKFEESGWTTLGEIADITGGVTKDSKRQSDPRYVEVPYLRVANVQRGFLDLSEIKTIRVPPETAEGLKLRPGDILFNEGGDRDKLGRGWIWEGQIPGCIHQNHVFRARLLTTEFSPKFISIHGNTFGQQWFDKMGKQTTNLASLNMTTLRQFPTPAPPLPDQEHIVAEMERRFSVIDQLEQEVETGLKRAERLRHSILASAFAGQLV